MKLANFSRELSDQLAGGPAIVAAAPVTAHAAGTASMHVATAVTIADAGAFYTSSTVEGALQEIGTVHRIYDEGTLVGTATTGFNFVGSNVSGTVTSGTAIITVSGSGSGAIAISEQDGSPSIGTATALIVPSGTLTDLGGGTAYLHSLPAGSVGVKLYHSTTQSISSGAWVAVTFDSEEYDTDGFHGTTYPTRITIPSALGGKYLLTFGGSWTAAESSYARFKKNGSLTQTIRSSGGEFTGSYQTHAVAVADLAGGDYVEIEVYTGSGGTLGDAGGSDRDQYQTSFSASLLDSSPGIPIFDEGSLMGTATTGLNFVGAGVSGTVTSGTAVITVSSGGSAYTYSYLRTSGNYTTTSTAFADVDATNMIGSAVLAGGTRLLVSLMGAVGVNNVAGEVAFDVSVDGNRIGSAAAYGIVYMQQHATSGEYLPLTMSLLTDVLAAGSHTVKPQWRVGNAAHTATIPGDAVSAAVVCQFHVIEVR